MRKILALSLAIVFFGSACGSADDDPPPATEAAAPTTAAPTTAVLPPTTTEAPPPTTAAPPPTTTEAPAPTTAAPPPTTTEAPPPTTAAAPVVAALPGAVEGTLLEGETPEGFDTLQSASTIPRPETCPGTPAYGGLMPVAYSESVWAADPLTGPFLDVSIVRFESADVASEALNNYRTEVVACGEFAEPTTGAVGSFTHGDDPGLGDESVGTDYTATFQGLPINRYGALVRIGDSVYSAGAVYVFVDPDKAFVLEVLSTFLGR